VITNAHATKQNFQPKKEVLLLKVEIS
jgi:hypothetical protein